MRLTDTSIVRGAARLMDLGGLLARHGERDHYASAQRAFQEAWASIGAAMQQGVDQERARVAAAVAMEEALLAGQRKASKDRPSSANAG